MVLVLVLFGGGLVAAKLYNALRVVNGDALDNITFRVRQQAGIIQAISTFVFAVLNALATGRPPTVPSPTVPASSVTTPTAAQMATATTTPTGATVVPVFGKAGS